MHITIILISQYSTPTVCGIFPRSVQYYCNAFVSLCLPSNATSAASPQLDTSRAIQLKIRNISGDGISSFYICTWTLLQGKNMVRMALVDTISWGVSSGQSVWCVADFRMIFYLWKVKSHFKVKSKYFATPHLQSILFNAKREYIFFNDLKW